MKRNDFIDYAKALCIAMVVFVHTGFSSLNNIFLFVLPMFFAATGYTFTPGKRSLRESVILRFKSIMLPYFLLMLIYFKPTSAAISRYVLPSRFSSSILGPYCFIFIQKHLQS